MRTEPRTEVSSRYRTFGTYRFALAVAVVVSHSWALRSDRADEISARIGIGNPAVMGFFVLSGFIIAEAVSTFYDRRPVAFAVNRALRIVPPYLAALVLSIAVHAVLIGRTVIIDANGNTPSTAVFSVRNLLYNLTAILPVNPGDPTYDFVDIVWAVRAEVLFYAAVFAYLSLEHWFGWSRRWRAGAGAAVVAVHVLSEYGPVPTGPLDLSFVPYFAAGVLLYVRRIGAAFAVCIGLIALHFSRYAQGKVGIGEGWLDGLTRVEVWGPTLITLALIPVVAWIARLIVSADGRRRDNWAGQLSYPIYLNHPLVLVLALTLFGQRADPATQTLVVAGSIAVAAVMNEVVERPLRQVRDRVRGHRL